jgi:hypothetical protein
LTKPSQKNEDEMMATTTIPLLMTISDDNLFKHELFQFLSINDYLSVLLTCKYFHWNLVESNNFKFTKLLKDSRTCWSKWRKLRDVTHLLPHCSYLQSTTANTLYEQIKYTIDRKSRKELPVRNMIALDETLVRQLIRYFPFDLVDFQQLEWFSEATEMDTLLSDFYNRKEALKILLEKYSHLIVTAHRYSRCVLKDIEDRHQRIYDQQFD